VSIEPENCQNQNSHISKIAHPLPVFQKYQMWNRQQFSAACKISRKSV